MKLFIALLALFFLPGSATAFVEGIQLIIGNPILLKYVLIGIGTGTVIYFILLRRWYYFLTFEHELTHAFISLLFLMENSEHIDPLITE